MLSGLLLAALLGRHPIHSSSATVTLPRGARVATVVLRVFADDFPPGRDSAAAARYLAAHFAIVERNGRRLGLELLELRTEGPVLIVTLAGPTPNRLDGARVWHGVLAERYRDQVNLVQASVDGRSGSLLFTADDGPKPLP